MVLTICIVSLCKLHKRDKTTDWSLNTSEKDLKQRYREALWGISMIAFWCATCIGYHCMGLLSDLTQWYNFAVNVCIADIRYYFEYFILLTFTINEITNASYELFESKLPINEKLRVEKLDNWMQKLVYRRDCGLLAY